MKKTIIGAVLLFSGLLIDLTLLHLAAGYLPHMNAWSNSYGSKLWFLIFAGTPAFSDGAHGLGLGPVFVCGAVLAILGLGMLLREYYVKEK